MPNWQGVGKADIRIAHVGRRNELGISGRRLIEFSGPFLGSPQTENGRGFNSKTGGAVPIKQRVLKLNSSGSLGGETLHKKHEGRKRKAEGGQGRKEQIHKSSPQKGGKRPLRKAGRS